MTLTLQPMSTAPRDGTRILVFERDDETATLRAWEARVVTTWVTNCFIPGYISDDDVGGLNHGAFVDELLIGWLPLPSESEGNH